MFSPYFPCCLCFLLSFHAKLHPCKGYVAVYLRLRVLATILDGAWKTWLQGLIAVSSHHCVTNVKIIVCLLVLSHFTYSRVFQAWVGEIESLRDVTTSPEDAQEWARVEEQGVSEGNDVKVCLCVAECVCFGMTSSDISHLYFPFLARGNVIEMTGWAT